MILLGSTCTWKIVHARAKKVNTHQYKASRRQSTHQGGHGPHGGAARLHLGTTRAHLGVSRRGQPPSTSLIHSNTLPSESIRWWQVDWSINVPRWKYKDPQSHHLTVGDQMHKNHSYPHSTSPGGHRTEDGGPSPQ